MVKDMKLFAALAIRTLKIDGEFVYSRKEFCGYVSVSSKRELSPQEANRKLLAAAKQ
jgi:hypothetical protein